ncbi:MAG TPA: hypothetical protein VJ044_16230, partial [Candidatus Hodarchaeales archaeon]|nr:hypothetical protein [Candidatus Hodarchaeales archaeon]
QHRMTQVSEYAKLKNFGMGLDELRNYLAYYRELGREDVREAIRSIDPNQLVIVGIQGIR